jgi:hypothetical protein
VDQNESERHRKGAQAFPRAVIFLIATWIAIPLNASADEGVVTPEPQAAPLETKKAAGLSSFNTQFREIFAEPSAEDVTHKPRIRPHFVATTGYISNASLRPGQKDHAWQARVAPGLTLSFPWQKLYTEVDYTYGFNTTQGNRTSANINTHTLNALARYDLSADTVLGVGNNIQWSEIPLQGGRTFTLETATAQAKHRFGERLDTAVTNTFQWFNDNSKDAPFDQTNEFVDEGIKGEALYKLFDSLSIGPSFGWNIRSFNEREGKNYWQINPALNAFYKLGSKTTFGGNFGWTHRKFTDEGFTVGDTESELTYGASARHVLGRKLIWSIEYQKTLQDTFDTSFILRDDPHAVTQDNLDRTFRVLKSHRIGTSTTYFLTERHSLGAFGDFQFISGDEDDHIVTRTKNHEKAMEIGATYTFRLNKYVNFDLNYIFGRRFSSENNPNRNEYTFHMVTAGVNISR